MWIESGGGSQDWKSRHGPNRNGWVGKKRYFGFSMVVSGLSFEFVGYVRSWFKVVRQFGQLMVLNRVCGEVFYFWIF